MTRNFRALAAPAAPVLAVALLAAAVPCASAGPAPERKYSPVRFDEDWTWIETAPPAAPDPFDEVKSVKLSESWRFLLGGSARLRFEADDNRTLGASAVESDELLRFRTLLHWQLQHRKDFRWFAEVRYADTVSSDRVVPGTMEDDPDVENFFLEGTFASATKHPVSVRAGRQEMIFGNQKLVSPLDWSNTRRTFDGLSVIARTKRTKTSIFATRPVLHEEHEFDSPSDDVSFSGVTVQVKPKDGHVVEGYAWLLHDSSGKYRSETTAAAGDVDRMTWGGRYEWTAGKGWTGDLEGAFQTGDAAGDDISAFMISVTAGHQWKEAAGKPRLSFGYDHASGNDDPADGDAATFDQLFPLGHAFFGHIDLVGRRNVDAERLQFEAWPVKGLRLEAAFHNFSLAEERDALYDAGGAVSRKDPSGVAGSDVGRELDVLVSWTWKLHHVFTAEVGYFWSGDFIAATGSDEDVAWGWLGYEFKF